MHNLHHKSTISTRTSIFIDAFFKIRIMIWKKKHTQPTNQKYIFSLEENGVEMDVAREKNIREENVKLSILWDTYTFESRSDR